MLWRPTACVRFSEKPCWRPRKHIGAEKSRRCNSWAWHPADVVSSRRPMSILGDILEILFGPHDPFKTVRATVRHWTNADLVENVTGSGRTIMGRRKTSVKDRSTPRIREETLSIWISRPDRTRIEERRQVEDRIETSLRVVNDKRWASRDFEGHVEMGETKTSRIGKKSGVALTDA